MRSSPSSTTKVVPFQTNENKQARGDFSPTSNDDNDTAEEVVGIDTENPNVGDLLAVGRLHTLDGKLGSPRIASSPLRHDIRNRLSIDPVPSNPSAPPSRSNSRNTLSIRKQSMQVRSVAWPHPTLC